MTDKRHLAQRSNKGFTLVEVLIALFLSAILIAIMTSLYVTSLRTFQNVKNVTDVKEAGKSGMAQLEWIFQRWGTSTPCFNLNPALCMQVQGCESGGAFLYPPPSSLCITIVDQSPCDEVYFYANLYGNGFVDMPLITNPSIMEIKSCRLTDDGCYHIKRGARFLVDEQTPAVYTPLVFSLQNLADNDISCADKNPVTNKIDVAPNTEVNSITIARNGQLEIEASPGSFTNNYEFEGGEVLMRVPHRVKLYCKNLPADNNRLWLYMEATDMAAHCNAHESSAPLFPVNSFKLQRQDEGVFATIQVRGTEGKTMDIQRFFGR